MSNASGVLTVVGYAAGSAYGGPVFAQYGAAIGGIAGGVVDYKNATKGGGPRIGDAQTISAGYGDVIPYVAGSARVGGQVWWASERRQTPSDQAGGKGGGPANASSNYEQDVLFGLTSIEIGDVARVFLNGKVVWTQRPDATIESIIASDETPLWKRITIYNGNASQLPDTTYEAAVGAGNAPAYRNRCSVFFEGLQLGSSGQLPNFAFEVVRNGLQTAFFNAPFTSSADDIVSPPATVIGTAPPSYGPNGGVFTQNMMFAEHLIYTTPSSGKLAIDMPSTKGVWSVRIQIEVAYDFFSGTGDNIRFFYTFGIAQWGFSYRRISGDVRLFAWKIENGVPQSIDLGRRFETGLYRIIFDTRSANASEWTVKWYVDNELLLSRASIYASIGNMSIGYTPGDSRGIATLTVKEFRVVAAGVGELVLAEPLRDVVERLCKRAGMPDGTYNATALSAITKPVRSLLLAQLSPTRAALQSLMMAYHFDCTLTDKLYFNPRATTPAAIIGIDDLASGVNNPSGYPLALTQNSDMELPAQVSVKYINVDNDYQAGVEPSDRLISGQVAMQSVEIGIGMRPTEAKAVADAIVDDNLVAMTTVPISLSMKYAHLQPADIVVVDGQTMRLGRKLDSHGVISFEARGYSASSIVSDGITDGATYKQALVVVAPSATSLHVLDIPLLRDADDGPGHYVAANGGTVWAGSSVQRSIDNVDYMQSLTVLERAVFGTCESTLGHFVGVGFDEVNSLSVSVGVGELSSTTRDSLLLNSQLNALLVGNEIVRFITATLTSTSPNRYTITRLLRGQRGTEWAMDGHVANERCVLLRPSGMRYLSTPQNEIGVGRWIKGVTVGASSASVDGVTYTNTGVSQKPFSPADLRVARVSSGAYALSWQRRTRLQTTFADGRGVLVPLGESAEVYEVDTFDSSDVLIRTTTTTAPNATIGGPGKEKTYAAGVLYPVTHSGKLYGVSYFGSLPEGQSRVHRFSATGVIEGSTVAFPGNVWNATNNGSGIYYVLTLETGPGGFISACKIRRIDLSTLTVTATTDLFSLFSEFGYSIAWDGTSLWSAAIAGATLRKHNATTLAVEHTAVLTNSATAPIGLASDGAGNIFASGKDWTKVVSFDSGSNSVNWTVDYAATTTQVAGVVYVGSMLFVWGAKVVCLDPSDGSIQSIFDEGQIGPVVNFDGDAAYVQSLTTVNSATGALLTVNGQCVVLDGSTGAVSSSFPVESDLRLLSGTVDGKLLVVSLNIGAGNHYLGHLYGQTPSLPGGRAVVYQMSSIVGRGYPAEITL